MDGPCIQMGNLSNTLVITYIVPEDDSEITTMFCTADALSLKVTFHFLVIKIRCREYISLCLKKITQRCFGYFIRKGSV